MKRRCSRKTGVTNENGYTLIFAVIIMAILAIVGAAVLTSASNSLNAVNRRIDSRQTYYVAKSVLNTIDSSLRNSSTAGSLGSSLRSRFYTKACQASDEAVSIKADVDFSDQLKGYKVKDMTISFAKPHMWNNGVEDENHIQGKNIRVDDLKISYNVVAGDQKYKLTAHYYYAAELRVDKQNNVTWTKGTEKWNLTGIDQN